MTVFGLIYMAIINPFVYKKDGELSRYKYRWAAERELKNPECLIYSIKPLAELTEPEYNNSEGNSGCYYIYNYRRFNNPDKYPYTADDLDRDFAWEYWKDIIFLSAFGSIVTLVLSSLVYALGAITAWIIGGFKK